MLLRALTCACAPRLAADGPRIFDQLGIPGFFFAALSGLVNFLSTVPAIALIDRTGRMVLLRWSAAGMALSCAAIAAVGDVCLAISNPMPYQCAHAAVAAVFFLRVVLHVERSSSPR